MADNKPYKQGQGNVNQPGANKLNPMGKEREIGGGGSELNRNKGKGESHATQEYGQKEETSQFRGGRETRPGNRPMAQDKGLGKDTQGQGIEADDSAGLGEEE